MTLYICKELAENVIFRTHNWKIVGSNPCCFNHVFSKWILSQVHCNKENKTHTQFSIYKHIQNASQSFFVCTLTSITCYYHVSFRRLGAEVSNRSYDVVTLWPRQSAGVLDLTEAAGSRKTKARRPYHSLATETRCVYASQACREAFC